MASIAMPRWLRLLIVAGVVVVVTGAGLFAYRWYSRPTTLTIAVGSLDGEAPKLVSAPASRLAATNVPVRLKLIETTSALEAADLFSSNKTDPGRVEQFFLRVGDVVNPLMRPAGILIPEGAGARGLQAGFGQIEAQVLRPGMVAEAACISRPWTIIPMVVTGVQDYIAAGQFRGGDQLIDVESTAKPGTILVFLEPLYQGGLEGVTAGSSCIVNAYTSNHELISSGKLGGAQGFGLHAIDAVGLVHAMLLRIQALLLPIKTLVMSGHQYCQVSSVSKNAVVSGEADLEFTI
jgi:hypothetical protein